MALALRYSNAMRNDELTLTGFPFLSGMSPTGRTRLLKELRCVSFNENDAILSRGDEVSGVYLVQQGAIRIYYVTPEGREGTLYWVEAGQSCILAINCTFSSVPYPAWVQADRAETRVAVVPGQVFRELFATETAIQKFTFDALSLRLFDLMARLEQAYSHGVEQRLARLLLNLGAESGMVTLSQERLAQHLGTAREVVSRSLRGMASRGLVTLNPGFIALRSRVGLASLAGHDGRENTGFL